jgi:hypothetical protein
MNSAMDGINDPSHIAELWHYDVICDDYNFNQEINEVYGQQAQFLDGAFHFHQEIDGVLCQQEHLLGGAGIDNLFPRETIEEFLRSLDSDSEPLALDSMNTAPERRIIQPAQQDEQEQKVEDVKQDLQETAPQKPKRSLSAYNFFFQDERIKLKSSGKIGFAKLARTIAAKWKQISPEVKMECDYLAAVDLERYEKEFAAWKKQIQLMKDGQRANSLGQTNNARSLVASA